MKLDNKDKKIITLCIILGIIFTIFIGDKSVDLVMVVLTLYFIHKYKDNIKGTEGIEFIDKEKYIKYIKGLDNIIKIINIYAVIRIILILTINFGGFNGIDLLMIGQVMSIYIESLERKYVKTVNGVKVEKNIKLINNKILVLIIFTIFIGFSYAYFNSIEFKDNYINTINYEYKNDYNEENKKEISFSGDYFSSKFTEDEITNEELNKYINDVKLLLKIDVLEEYSKISCLFMIILIFSQLNFKDKTKQSKTVFMNVFLILALVFSLVAFNTYSIDLEYKILSANHYNV